MIVTGCIALAAVLGFAVAAPLLGRRLPPAAAARLLVTGGLAAAGCSVAVLAAVTLLGLAQVPALAALGSWSPSAVRVLDPIPDPVAAGCGLALAGLAVAAAVGMCRRARALAAVYRCRPPGASPAGDPVIVTDDRPAAFTTPAPRGRVVVTTGLLARLDPRQREVVFAHEHAHLREHHVWWRLAADVAAAVNPLLRPAAATVADALERAADEQAARQVGDRVLVARTIAHVALLSRNTPAGADAVATATGGDVVYRVNALLAPPESPRRGRFAAALLIGLVLTATCGTAAVQQASDHLFDRAAPSAATAAAATPAHAPAPHRPPA